MNASSTQIFWRSELHVRNLAWHARRLHTGTLGVRSWSLANDRLFDREVRVKRRVTTLAVMLFSSITLRADVTVTMTTSVEAESVSLLNEAMAPRIVTRIKGTKMRTDV